MSTILVTEIKKRVLTARKAGDQHQVKLLSLILGEVDTLANSKGQIKKGPVTDEQIHGILRKVIGNNEETMRLAGSREILIHENEMLSSLLPNTWNDSQIQEFLVDEHVVAQICEANSDGQATGIAMKALKAANAPVEGNVVAQVVKNIRAQEE